MGEAAEFPSDDALDLIARSSSAAFAIDRNDRIVYWNEGATRLLGWSGAEMLGRFCFDVLEGRDPFGNLYCSKECPIVVGAASGERIEPFLMKVAAKGGGQQTVRVQAVPLPAGGEGFSCLMHLVDTSGSAEVEALVGRLRASASGAPVMPRPPDPPISVSPLTPREREVVQLLSNGFAALNIAAKLNLSHATVRNHIQNILRKLDVHSQVEAIAVSFRRGWI